MDKLDRIIVDPCICLGQPTLRGTRITVSVVRRMLAGASLAKYRCYPPEADTMSSHLRET